MSKDNFDNNFGRQWDNLKYNNTRDDNEDGLTDNFYDANPQYEREYNTLKLQWEFVKKEHNVGNDYKFELNESFLKRLEELTNIEDASDNYKTRLLTVISNFKVLYDKTSHYIRNQLSNPSLNRNKFDNFSDDVRIFIKDLHKEVTNIIAEFIKDKKLPAQNIELIFNGDLADKLLLKNSKIDFLKAAVDNQNHEVVESLLSSSVNLGYSSKEILDLCQCKEYANTSQEILGSLHNYALTLGNEFLVDERKIAIEEEMQYRKAMYFDYRNAKYDEAGGTFESLLSKLGKSLICSSSYRKFALFDYAALCRLQKVGISSEDTDKAQEYLGNMQSLTIESLSMEEQQRITANLTKCLSEKKATLRNQEQNLSSLGSQEQNPNYTQLQDPRLNDIFSEISSLTTYLNGEGMTKDAKTLISKMVNFKNETLGRNNKIIYTIVKFPHLKEPLIEKYCKEESNRTEILNTLDAVMDISASYDDAIAMKNVDSGIYKSLLAGEDCFYLPTAVITP